MNFGAAVINNAGSQNPRGLYSDGQTMYVLDDEDLKVYALKISDRTRDVSRDMALDAANEDAEGLWYGIGVLWVADDGDDKLYSYRLNRTDENGLTIYNLPPEGRPTISGTAQVGMALTAVTSGITDTNGLGAFSYQWSSSDGSPYADISGATSSSLTPLTTEQGKTVKVRVTYTDSHGFMESLSSEASVAVAAAEDDTAALTVSFGQGIYHVDEGDSLDVTVNLSADPRRDVTIGIEKRYQSGATPSDLVTPFSSVTFNSGQTQKTLTVTANNDLEDDDNESVVLSFGTLPNDVSAGTPSTASISIRDTDEKSVTPSKSELPIDEGSDGTTPWP